MEIYSSPNYKRASFAQNKIKTQQESQQEKQQQQVVLEKNGITEKIRNGFYSVMSLLFEEVPDA